MISLGRQLNFNQAILTQLEMCSLDAQIYHYWIISGSGKDLAINHDVIFLRVGKNRLPVSVKAFLRCAREWRRADLVVFNGLFYSSLVKLLLAALLIGKNKAWIVWGGDLHREFGWFQSLAVRALSFKHVGISFPKDWDIYRTKFQSSRATKAEFWFPSTVNKHRICTARRSSCSGNALNILIGNSATRSNNHFEVFEYLSRRTDQDFNLLIPLSYGDRHYAGRVLAAAELTFGQGRVEALVDYLSPDEYLDWISQSDAAVFNSTRQQAGQSIILLAACGIPVYINKQNPIFDFLLQRGIEVHSTNALPFSSNFQRPSKLSQANARKLLSTEFEVAKLKAFFSTALP